MFLEEKNNSPDHLSDMSYNAKLDREFLFHLKIEYSHIIMNGMWANDLYWLNHCSLRMFLLLSL